MAELLPPFIARFGLMFVMLLLGAAIGDGLESNLGWSKGTAWGVGLAAVVCLAWDSWRAGRLLRGLGSESSLESVAVGGIWSELTQRIRRHLRILRQQVAQEQTRLQDFLSALQASPNGVVLLDAQARIEWCNLRACEHFGLDSQRDRQQIIGNLVREPVFVQFMAQRDYGRFLHMSGHADRASRPVKLSVHLHPYGEGRMLLLSSDITALEQAEAQRRDFVANVSHEIRTPLTVLSGFIETLQTLELEPEERAHYLDLMGQQSARMQSLVSDLLTLSKLEGSLPPGLDDWTPLAPLLHQVQRDSRALAALIHAPSPLGLQLQFDWAFVGDISGAPNELMSALGNLLSNAVRYTPAGGRVSAKAYRTESGEWVYSVTDTGPGIAREHLGRLTERFYRVDRSRSRESGGTGLGLAIVKHVAQRHGARLEIRSQVGEGSCFSLVFPASRIRAHQPLAADASAALETA
jgi:two-component system phosphate regulon sensor histidine kinase PhoR